MTAPNTQTNVAEAQWPFWAIAGLIDTALAELRSCDEDEPRSLRPLYVPAYLASPREAARRDRVARCLNALRVIIAPGPEEPPEPSTIALGGLPKNGEIPKIIVPVFAAILYSAMEERYRNFYEYAAACNIRKTCRDELTQLWSNVTHRIPTGLQQPAPIELICLLVHYHKIADRVVYDRLSKRVFRDALETLKIQGGVSLQLGVMAAATYNSSGELTIKKLYNERITSILQCWGQERYPESAFSETQWERYDEQRRVDANGICDIDILWDYALCDKPWTESRYVLNNKLFCGFRTIVRELYKNCPLSPGDKQKSWDEHIYTINYPQTRMALLKDYQQALGRRAGHRYFSLVPEVVGQPSLTILELRLNERIALQRLLGRLGDMEMLSQKADFDWLGIIEQISEAPEVSIAGTFDKDHLNGGEKGNPDLHRAARLYCPFPLKEYLPLPLLRRYFGFAATYHGDSLTTVDYSYSGQEELAFDRYFRIQVPRPDGKAASLTATIEKLLAAYAVNIGMCVGYNDIKIVDRGQNAQRSTAELWGTRVADLLSHRKCGYELFLRYLETYMRAHDLILKKPQSVSPEWPGTCYAIGVDVGGASIRYRLYKCRGFRFEQAAGVEEHRTGTAKANTAHYNSLSEFAERILTDIEAYAESWNGVRLEDVKLMGISWPGAARKDRIAAASTILGYFDRRVASNLIRENSVDQIRNLDLVGLLKSKRELAHVLIGLTNDGTAEAIGRMVDNRAHLFPDDQGGTNGKVDYAQLNPKWCILKLGTGTAGAVFVKDRVLSGPAEFGKLILNVFASGRHELGDEHQPPSGRMNELASGKLLPAVFREDQGTDFDATSYEIGRIATYLDDATPRSQHARSKADGRLLQDLGLDYVHHRYLATMLPKARLQPNKDAGRPSPRRKLGQLVHDRLLVGRILRAIGLFKPEDWSEYLRTIGEERLYGLTRWGDLQFLEDEDRINKRDTFDRIFAKAGSVLADAIMLIHEYYRIHGIVLCGGVFAGYTGRKLLPCIATHLNFKYSVSFKNIGEYQMDLIENSALGVKERTTIYYLVNDDVHATEVQMTAEQAGDGGLHSGRSEAPPIGEDKGAVGALYHVLLSNGIVKDVPSLIAQHRLYDTIDNMVKLSKKAEDLPRKDASRRVLLDELTDLTGHAIELKDACGQLRNHPYEHIKQQEAPVSPDASQYLQQKCILVTGAGGQIGSMLCQRLLEFQPARLVLVDRNPLSLSELRRQLAPHVNKKTSVRIEECRVDVAHASDMRRVFKDFHPHTVFHLAAQREPGASEHDAKDAILTNILGTENLCRLAYEFHVERFIHASTGKCRFIYDNRVYPATKKYAEVVVKITADESDTCYSLVRFHHVVDNSIVERTFRKQIERNIPLSAHLPPDRNKHGQSGQEAVAMLLNAGVYGRKAEVFASSRQMDYFSVLDLALYLVKKSGKSLPVLFRWPRTDEGYLFKEFAGTRLASDRDKKRVTHSFNLIETANLKEWPALNLVATQFPTFDKKNARKGVKAVLAIAKRKQPSAKKMRDCLCRELWDLAVDVYSRAPTSLLVAALVQGVSPASLPEEDVGQHLPILTILQRAIGSRWPDFDDDQKNASRRALEYLHKVLPDGTYGPSLIEEVTKCKTSL